jgi:hypothetical protein
MARLFTVPVTMYTAQNPLDGKTHRAYEADFAGIHFSRASEADLKHWVRVAARRIYGPDTQVIFLHIEG